MIELDCIMGKMQISGTRLGYVKGGRVLTMQSSKFVEKVWEVIKKTKNEILYTKGVHQSVQGRWSRWQAKSGEI